MAKITNAEELMMVGDGNGEFSKAVGIEMDGTGFGSVCALAVTR